MMMKKCLVLLMVLGIASLATAGLSITATDLGGGDWLVEAIQDGPNAAGSGGVFTLTADSGVLSAVEILPVAVLDMGPPMSMYGWNWSIAGALETGLEVSFTAIPNLGAGTPGVGSLVDPMSAGMYTSTASFIVNGGNTVTLAGEWDTVILAQTVDVPEPMTMGLLGLGGLFLRRRK
jgi:hypothetical protein